MSWLKRWRRRRNCMHHEPWIGDGEKYAKSWIQSELVDMARKKYYWCTNCRQGWMR